MNNQIYMVIGCPGSGKSWVCSQLIAQYEYVRHDSYMNEAEYVKATGRQSKTATKPLLIETPFSVSKIKGPLEDQGFSVVPVFIQEHHEVIEARYRGREGKPLPTGDITRQTTFMARALEWQSFHGTSAEVLAYLKNAAPPAKERYPWET